jgi:hypothetical protein
MSETDEVLGRTNIPRGLEVLLKKAAVDPEFKALLLNQRAEAAATIGLELAPSEVLMLQSAPVEQLEAVIARTTVPQEHRRAFLGQAAAAMLAALAATTLGSGCTQGSRPDRPPAPAGDRPDPPPKPAGIRPDDPVGGSRPDRPPDDRPK